MYLYPSQCYRSIFSWIVPRIEIVYNKILYDENISRERIDLVDELNRFIEKKKKEKKKRKERDTSKKTTRGSHPSMKLFGNADRSPSNIYCIQTVPGCLQSTAMLNRHRPFSVGSCNVACRKRDTRVHDQILPSSPLPHPSPLTRVITS